MIDFLRNDPAAVKKGHEIKNELIVTTSINVFEILIGLLGVRQPNQKLVDSFMSFLGSIEVLEFNSKSSFQASAIGAGLLKKGNAINAADCLIAGAMLSHNCKRILTRDKQHFGRIQGISVESY